jgi:protein-S-isoprenylcysteine O-methyltransferase Ste14
VTRLGDLTKPVDLPGGGASSRTNPKPARSVTVTDVKLAQVNAPTGKNGIADCGVDLWLDWTSRAAIVISYGGFALLGVASVPRLLPLDSVHKLLMIAASIANVLFLSLVALTAITRLVPIQKSKGIEARTSALLGAFLSIALAFLPKAELGPIWSILSTTLILVGTSLSFVVLCWLGKSFSILAEARRLVIDGPYRIVRHPLYLCEGVALVGVTLQVLSPLAVLIAIVVAMVQCRRMINEEAILRLAFPEYHAYAANTPFLIPTKLGRMAHQAGHNKPSLEAIDPQAWHRASVESFHGKLDTMRSVIEVAALRGTRAKQSISGKADMAEAPKKSWKEAAQQLPPH